MWWIYILVFLGGAIVGLMLMALMAALPKDSEQHEVHVYCDEDGNMQIMTFPMEDKVIWHKKPEELEV